MNVCLLWLVAGFFTQPCIPVVESPKVWTAMANNPHLDQRFRRWCVGQLAARHARPGMRAVDFARLLDNPTWLKDEFCCFNNVAFCGYIPVDITADSTTISLRVLPEADDSCRGAIYLRVSGKMDQESWSRLLRGHAATQTRDSVVLQVVPSFD